MKVLALMKSIRGWETMLIEPGEYEDSICGMQSVTGDGGLLIVRDPEEAKRISGLLIEACNGNYSIT